MLAITRITNLSYKTNYEVRNITEIEPVIKDEDDRPEPEPEENADDFDDIPFEVTRPKKDDDNKNSNQMSLF